MRMKQILITLLIFCSGQSYGQINFSVIEKGNLPNGLQYSGSIKVAYKWSDNLGLNYVLLTETGEFRSKTAGEEEGKNKALYAYHFVQKPDSVNLVWRVYDFQKECPFDILLHFIDSAFTITDLDKNGIAEIWVMYITLYK